MNEKKNYNNIKFLKINNQQVAVYESSRGYVSPYSLFMVENFPLNFSDSTVLCDYGAGTGILGIVSSLYGVTDITSIENNEECFELLIENYKRNKINDKKLRFIKHNNQCEKMFDVIVCNPASLPNVVNVNSFCNGGVFGIDMILEVLRFSFEHLIVGGKLFIVITSVLPLSLIKIEMKQLKLKYRIIDSKIIPFRTHYDGLAKWVDEKRKLFPEMYYIKEGDKFFEELLLFEVEKELVV